MSKGTRTFSSMLALVALPLAAACAKDVTGPPAVILDEPDQVELRVEPSWVVVQLGESVQLEAMTGHDRTPLGSQGIEVLWSSSNPEIVAVSASGVLEARGIGTARITAMTEAHTAFVGVTVIPTRNIDPPGFGAARAR